MPIEEAKSLLRFLTWERNRHIDDVDKIEADIHVIISKYPELKPFYDDIFRERKFRFAQDV